jgi:hypothetical protein
MSKVYNALTITEAERMSRGSAEPTAPAALAFQTANSGELDTIRSILVGNLPEMIGEALERLGAKVSEQASAFRGEIEELERRFEKRITDIEARANASRSELRDQILSQSKLLSDSIQERSEHAIQVSMKGVTELHEAKLDRSSFADFLRQTSEHLATSAERES